MCKGTGGREPAQNVLLKESSMFVPTRVEKGFRCEWELLKCSTVDTPFSKCLENFADASGDVSRSSNYPGTLGRSSFEKFLGFMFSTFKFEER